jgi:hypothetical protein
MRGWQGHHAWVKEIYPSHTHGSGRGLQRKFLVKGPLGTSIGRVREPVGPVFSENLRTLPVLARVPVVLKMSSLTLVSPESGPRLDALGGILI